MPFRCKVALQGLLVVTHAVVHLHCDMKQMLSSMLPLVVKHWCRA